MGDRRKPPLTGTHALVVVCPGRADGEAPVFRADAADPDAADDQQDGVSGQAAPQDEARLSGPLLTWRRAWQIAKCTIQKGSANAFAR
jgi:hypothetical protein